MDSTRKTKNTIKVLTDLPVKSSSEAAFGFDSYSQVLTTVIMNSDSPLTIGVFGDWGTGKTSLMKMVYSNLQSSQYQPDAFPVWFNAWRYENEKNPILSLLYTILDEIKIRAPDRSDLKSITDFLDSFVFALSEGLSLEFPIGFVKAKYSPKDSLKEAREDLAKRSGLENKNENAIYYDTFRYLEKVIDDLHPKLIIFVDDLDRCFSENAIQLLEAIKLFFDFEGIVFVIGLDRNVIEKAAMRKYGENSGIDGSTYIKKLIQVPFSLPTLRPDDIETFVKKLISELQIPSNAKLERMIASIANANPREIKRLLNNFVLTYQLHPDKDSPEKSFLLLAFQQRWPSLYHDIVQNQALFINFYQRFNEIKVGRSKSEIKELLSSEELPFLQIHSISNDALEFIIESDMDVSFTSPRDLEEILHFTSIASYEVLQPDEILFHHTILQEYPSDKTNPHHRYQWQIAPVASEKTKDRIRKIVYQLPSSYPENTRITTIENDFTVTSRGWGNIEIDISVHLKSGEVFPFKHYLNFSKVEDSLNEIVSD